MVVPNGLLIPCPPVSWSAFERWLLSELWSMHPAVGLLAFVGPLPAGSRYTKPGGALP